MERRNFFKFVFISFLTILAGEFQVNILVLNKGAGDYLGTLVLYVPFIIIMYLVSIFVDLKVSSKRSDLVCYFTGGLFGLIAYEWFLIGNAPWAGTGAIQAGMFAWWAAIPTISRIFTTTNDPSITPTKRKIATSLVVYSLLTTAIVAMCSMNLRPVIAALMMAAGFIFINFQFIPFFIRNGSSKTFARAFMWLLVFLSIANLFI